MGGRTAAVILEARVAEVRRVFAEPEIVLPL